MNLLRQFLILALALPTSSFPTLPTPPPLYTFPPTDPVWPEGIATHPLSPYFYTASTTTGSIYRGHLFSPTITPFITSPTALGNLTTAWGTKLTRDGRHLLVCSGTQGTVHLFSLAAQTVVAVFDNGLAPTGWTWINDAAVDYSLTGSGDVLVTDSLTTTLYKITAAELTNVTTEYERTGIVQTRGLTQFIDMSPWAPDLATHGPYIANGLTFLPGGRYAIVGIMTTGYLVRVDLLSGATAAVESATGNKLFAHSDGLLYRHPYLFSLNAIHNPSHPSGPLQDFITVIKLSRSYLRGEIVGTITDPSFNVSTTMAFVPGTSGGEALVVNHQLTGGVPVLPFTVSRVGLSW